VTDPGNPGQPYGGQPYGGQPGQPYGDGGHYGPPADSSGGHYGPPASTPPYGGGEAPYPGGPVPPAPYPGGPVPPPAKKNTGKVLGIVGGVIVVVIAACIGIGVFAFNSAKKDPANAKVGNCLAGQTMDSTTAQPVNDVKIVDCTSTDAKYKVVGVVENKTESQFRTDDKICSAYTTAESALWQGTPGKSGSVLCLEPLKK
jgi:hypothetical protein